ncbi:hypothetical protein SAMN05421858_5064 [Haladaptatus litoreus]|uniref:Uncharacterized protein n=2 Tax=Haladaptatus litoreus TaxID=553468 RepID=A0A1N7FHM7_9EURY|nr:hypothetical protein SAMN05421858_5064 [Haladaptatus litoreus]
MTRHSRLEFSREIRKCDLPMTWIHLDEFEATLTKEQIDVIGGAKVIDELDDDTEIRLELGWDYDDGRVLIAKFDR